MEKTIIILKPDAIERKIAGLCIQRFEQKGLKIVGMKMIQLTKEILREHYAHVTQENFYPSMEDFMISTPVIVICLEGENSIQLARSIAGIKIDERGSIRGDFATGGPSNIIHSSDSSESAEMEIQRFFTSEELYSYEPLLLPVL